MGISIIGNHAIVSSGLTTKLHILSLFLQGEGGWLCLRQL